MCVCVCVPTALPNAHRELCVRSLVRSVRTTSTSFIIGTGLKKWRPPNLSLRLVASAISAIGREEVLLANIVSARAVLSSWENSCCFTAIFSTIASTTRSQLAPADSWSVVQAIRAMVESTKRLPPSASSANFFLTTRSKLLRMRAEDFSNN